MYNIPEEKRYSGKSFSIRLDKPCCSNTIKKLSLEIQEINYKLQELNDKIQEISDSFDRLINKNTKLTFLKKEFPEIYKYLKEDYYVSTYETRD